VVSVSLNSLVAVRITSVGHRSRAAWAEGSRVHLPASVLDRTGWRHALRPNGDLEIPPEPASIADHDVAGLRELRAFTERPPLSARLPVSYRLAPGWARAMAASVIGRWNRHRADRWAAFPGWPIDLSADVLDDLRDATVSPHPPGARAPVVLTHDIDSPEGLKNLVARFLPLEEAVGARSTSYIVPCAWPLDHSLIAELVARGHEVGVHGYDHSNVTPFTSDRERRRRLDAARPFAERYGVTGYRAPSLLRTRPLLRALGARYLYDSSIPTAGGPFPVPNNGCATARPFFVEQIAELPLTLPRDGSLRFLGYSAEEIAQLWIECADLVASASGVVVLLTHCEERFSGGAGMLDAYRRLLKHLCEGTDRFTFSTPVAVIDAFREREMRRAPDATRATAS
jgi:peptidoglycan/xylan/chitin deacetylase (PgdA/CDA1 family)